MVQAVDGGVDAQGGAVLFQQLPGRGGQAGVVQETCLLRWGERLVFQQLRNVGRGERWVQLMEFAQQRRDDYQRLRHLDR